MRMRILLLEADSSLGRAVLRLAAQEGIQIEALARPLAGWQPEQLADWLDEYSADAVINLAYFHEQFQVGMLDPVELAALDEFSRHLAELCASESRLLVQPSSARVFDGLKPTPYNEKDQRTPGDALGAVQAELEKLLAERCPRYAVLRFSWLLDGSADGQLAKLVEQLHGDEPVLLAEEWRGNPTPVDDAARVLLAVLKQLDCEAPLSGIYHYGSTEPSSWISFAKSLAQELMANNKLDRDPVIRSVPFDKQTEAGWEPQNAVLASRRILMTFGVKPRPWRGQLAQLLASVESTK
ncbi:sugar nucleotide-binding protein [Halopseudomonas sp.]|uniref:sugar nucleotide-binding protein n=1 Tax=Halopseudomonas sp. TaxID=2901191 RepID=UPI0035686331